MTSFCCCSQINPVNEYDPVWDTAPANVVVLETASVGTLVHTVSATDSDLGLDGSVSYSIVSVTDGTAQYFFRETIQNAHISSFCQIISNV